MYTRMLDPWRGMIAMGLTTWAEQPGTHAIRLTCLERLAQLRSSNHCRGILARLAWLPNRQD